MFERIHGDGLLLGIGYVSALVVTADTFIGVARINHNHIRLLLHLLPQSIPVPSAW